MRPLFVEGRPAKSIHAEVAEQRARHHVVADGEVVERALRPGAPVTVCRTSIGPWPADSVRVPLAVRVVRSSSRSS